MTPQAQTQPKLKRNTKQRLVQTEPNVASRSQLQPTTDTVKRNQTQSNATKRNQANPNTTKRIQTQANARQACGLGLGLCTCRMAPSWKIMPGTLDDGYCQLSCHTPRDMCWHSLARGAPKNMALSPGMQISAMPRPLPASGATEHRILHLANIHFPQPVFCVLRSGCI